MSEQIINYKPNAIDPAILDVLDINKNGKVITAADWTSLWNLVIGGINHIDAYCTSVDALFVSWSDTVKNFEDQIADFNKKYNTLNKSFIHYGKEAPEDPNIRLWVQPVDDPEGGSEDLHFITRVELNAALVPKANTGWVLQQLGLKADMSWVAEQLKNVDILTVGIKTPESGEIFNDYENNTALSAGSSASGLMTQAGNKAFKILSIVSKGSHTYDVTVRGNVTSGKNPYVVGDVLQITANVNFNNSFKIASIRVDSGTSVLGIEKVDSRSVQAMSLGYEHPSNAENWLYVAGKDNGETCPWLIGAFASGIETVVSGTAAFGSGHRNVVAGDFAAGFGLENKVGYAGFTSGAKNETGDYGFASGNGNKATGIDSVATGVNTQATKYASRAGGSGTTARNEFAVAEGLGTRTYRQAQFVCGQYNKARKNTLFEVGNGASATSVSNAFEVYEDGSIALGGVTITPAQLTKLLALIAE